MSDTGTPEGQEGTTKRETKGAVVDKIISDCRDLIKQVVDIDGDNRAQAVDDLEFLSGDQWPDDIQRAREIDQRPIITVNTLPTYLRQVTNDQRQNKGGIKVHPVDDDADAETAEVIQGLIRHIEYDSNADVAYDTAVGSAAANGFGWFRLVTEYASETSFNQDIKFKRIRNPLTVYPGYHEQPDASDMMECAISVKMPKEQFKREYPDADMAGFDALQGVGDWSDWVDEQFVRVAEFYRIEQESCEVVLLSNGESGFKDKLLQMPAGVTIVKTRPGTRSKVMWSKLTAVEELESAEIKCKWIPVFPVYGDEIDIEGRVIRSGLIRHAKDPVRMNNYWLTKATEEVALRGLAPYIGAEGQFEGYEEEWQQANNRAFAYMTYKPVTIDGTLAPAPQRQQMADVPTGTLAMAAHSADNIQKTIGIFNAGIGEKSNETSGKAILARQREGDVGTFHYTDNLNLSRKHAGRCIISMLPHYYDTERAVRILGDDGKATSATLNQPNTAQEKSKDGEVRDVLNNVCAGTYDVTVTTGPSYSTARTEAAEYLTQVAQGAKDPATSTVVTYLAIKNSDMPGAEQATKMLEKLPVISQLVDKTGEDGEEMIQTPKGPIPVSQAGAAIAGMDQALTQAEQALNDANALDKQNKATELQIKGRELDIKGRELEVQATQAETEAFKAETERMSAERDAQANADQSRETIAADERVRSSADAALSAPIQALAEGIASVGAAVQLQGEALAAIAQAEAQENEQARKPKIIRITAPSGGVYTGELVQ